MPSTQFVHACIDNSSLRHAVCDYAAWIALSTSVSLRLQYNVESAQTAGSLDLSGAVGLGTQAKLLDDLADVDARQQAADLAQGKALLAEARGRVQAAGVETPQIKLHNMDLTDDLIGHQDEISVLVMGAWGAQHEDDHRLAKRIEVLARKMQAPILVANQAFKRPRRAAFIFDESEAGSNALAWVANSPLCSLVDIYLVKLGEETQAFTDAARQLRLANRVVHASCLMKGTSIEQLLAFMLDKECDLLALGAFRHNRLHDLVFGSFTSQVLKKANVPVLLLR